jgi:pimeloyl-ACP methyl ester carboxylesterase
MQALVYDIRHPGFRAWLTQVIRWTFTHSPARRIFPDIVFAGPRPADDFLYGHFLANLVSPARTAGRLNLLFASDTFTLNRILTPQTDVRNSLLLWGARNKATPLRPHAAYHQRLCQIPKLHVIPQGGHMAMYENPELVNDLIARHLASAGIHTPSTTPAP